MKILVTGMNKNQCTENFYLQQQLQVIPSHPSLLACLRDMGHEVVQRPVILGESVQEYDLAIVYLHNPTAFCGYAYGALWTIASHNNVVLAYDDWQIDSIRSGILRLTRPDQLWNRYLLEQHEKLPHNFRDYSEHLYEALDAIEQNKHGLLISAFAGGDVQLLLDHPHIITYNPNPYHHHRQGSNLWEKRRHFNFASLVQGKTARWLKKQGVEKWPVDYYGSRKDKQVRLTEQAMCDVYARDWGCLMPGYFHAGSGWWRARPTQVADVGSIIIGDPQEMFVLYRDHELANLRAQDLECASDSKLEEYAVAQREALYRHHPLDREAQQQELARIL